MQPRLSVALRQAPLRARAATTAAPRIGRELSNEFDLPHEVLADQRALRPVPVADSLGRCCSRRGWPGAVAASRLSSACSVEPVAICAARRSAELGRRVVGCADKVTFCLTAIAVSVRSH